MGRLADSRAIAFDSGGTHLVKGVEIVTDPVTGVRRWRVWGLSRLEWRNQREDDKRLETTEKWCARLRAPGGAFDRLTAVTRKTSSSEQFGRYCAVAHGATTTSTGQALATPVTGANVAVFAEKKKKRWANAAFTTWCRGQSILHGFWARVKAGRYEDGTAGVNPMILYGNAKFASSGPGRRAGPTVRMRKACVDVCGVSWVRDADEHRSSKCCSGCGEVLATVTAPTPQRVLKANAARLKKQAKSGYGLARPASARRTVRGKMLCRNTACPVGFVHRDIDAAKLILLNALAKEAAELVGMVGGLECMRHVHRPKSRVKTFRVY